MDKKIEFEMYRNKISGYDIERMKQNQEPHCHNGTVYYKRYKVTVELIEEDEQVYRDRLNEMNESTGNIHHRSAIGDELKKIKGR